MSSKFIPDRSKLKLCGQVLVGELLVDPLYFRCSCCNGIVDRVDSLDGFGGLLVHLWFLVADIEHVPNKENLVLGMDRLTLALLVFIDERMTVAVMIDADKLLARCLAASTEHLRR